MSDLTVTDVEPILVEGPRPWLFVRVHTKEGVTGLGEIPRTRHTVSDVERLGDRLIGRDPFETERLFGAGGDLGAAANDVFTTTIVGGLDMACWDIKGKTQGLPVYNLLGGKLRDEVRAYANGWDFDIREIVDRYHAGEDRDVVLADTTAAYAEAARTVVDAGYRALKFSPFQWGHGSNTTRAELDAAIDGVAAVADAVPNEVEILVEGHSHLTVEKASLAAEKLAPFEPGFYEEPVPANVEPLRRIARRSPVPIATGEQFVTHHPFADLISRTDVSVVQPDVGRAGGITALGKIAAMASADRVALAPHNAAGPVMTAAAVHVDCTTRAFMIQETFEHFFHPAWAADLLETPLEIADGRISVPDRPGLGVALDEDVLADHRIDSV